MRVAVRAKKLKLLWKGCNGAPWRIFFLRSQAGQRIAAWEKLLLDIKEATWILTSPSTNECGCQGKKKLNFCEKGATGPLGEFFFRSEAGKCIATFETLFLDIKEATWTFWGTNVNACGCQSKKKLDFCEKGARGPLGEFFYFRSELRKRIAALETLFLEI